MYLNIGKPTNTIDLEINLIDELRHFFKIIELT